MSNVDDDEKKKIFNDIKNMYDKQSDPRYGAARLWIDEIIDPRDTRKVLIASLEVVSNEGTVPTPKYGAMQV